MLKLFYDFQIVIFYFKLPAYTRIARNYTPKNAAGMNANGSKSWCLSRLAGWLADLESVLT